MSENDPIYKRAWHKPTLRRIEPPVEDPDPEEEISLDEKCPVCNHPYDEIEIESQFCYKCGFNNSKH